MPYQNITVGETTLKENTHIVELLCLRTLVKLGGSNAFISAHTYSSDSLAEFIGVSHWIDNDDIEYNPKLIRKEIIKRYNKIEDGLTPFPAKLDQHVQRFADVIELSEVDKTILLFSILVHQESILESAFETLGYLSTKKAMQAYSLLLGIDEKLIRQSLHKHSVLAQTGILKFTGSTSGLTDKIELISDEFVEELSNGETEPLHLLREFITQPPQAELNLEHYSHIQKQLDILLPFLKIALEENRKGVNFYIYGPPGTGKTQLAKVISEHLNTELFEISNIDSEDNPISGVSRLGALNAAQKLLDHRKAILLFDEVEDVFSHSPLHSSAAQSNKSWMTSMLEENTVPCIWLSNTKHGLDPAFMRRYSMVFELPVPNRGQREAIIKDYTGELLTPTTVSQAAQSAELAPAVVAQMANVTQTVNHGAGQHTIDDTFITLINNSLKAQSFDEVSTTGHNKLPAHYSLDYVNCDTNLDTLVSGINQHGSARLCLYGPPGTGKTAFGHYLSHQLDKELLIKTASDLISPYLGQTEQNIASAFKEAQHNQNILMIDEVDSFLQERSGATHNWEVSQVNEMLTQMENFEGLFMASTNLMHSLDNAVFRRFDLKLQFSYMSHKQTSSLLKQFCQQHNLSEPDDAELNQLKHCTGLTPGDFASLSRRQRFNPTPSAAALIQQLQAEKRLKKTATSTIGFVH